ncbi:GNAT family N-acetyltransferase [Salirhabdus sp. Marseille-P4669]|uniref:GNAT family N-acetyltransferase n=1 Tax=Salirhabdus sp. Marseille-P4669 TaxID=2042310 RepID=UPI000C7BBDFA|nr:GNAT family protein [Salirhabdus sp. Marseille-P4669]
MDFPTLSTKRLRLVKVDKQYTKALFDIMSNDEVTKYYGMESLTSIEQAQQIIESFDRSYRQGFGIRFGIVLKETGQFIGTVGLNNLVTRMKRAEIGYEIHPAFWRKGYTSEAVKRVINYAFHELGLYRIGAVTFPENAPSWRLLEKLNFTKEGTLRGYIYQHGQSNNTYVWSILRPDWVRD